MADKSVLIIVAVLICLVSMIIAGTSYYEGWTCSLGFGNGCPSSGSSSSPTPTTPSGGDSGSGTPTGDGGSGSGDSGSGDSGSSGSGSDSGSSGSGSGSGSSGSGSLIITTPNQACVGHWGDCSVTCGGGTKSWIVDRKPGSSGAVCKDENGTPMTDSSGNLTAEGQSSPCNTNACTQDCLGSWSGWSPCSAQCGTGTQTNTFTVLQPPGNGGLTCLSKYGISTTGTGTFTQTRNCPNLPLCKQDCIGSWGQWGGCVDDYNNTVTCTVPGQTANAKQHRTYVISTPAYGGGGGCKDENGTPVTDSYNNLLPAGYQSQACSPVPSNCCDQLITSGAVGPWTTNGNPVCYDGVVPTQQWTRTINWGGHGDIGQACSLAIGAFTRSADNTPSGAPACPAQHPTSGSCPNGVTWNNQPGNQCALPDVIASYSSTPSHNKPTYPKVYNSSTNSFVSIPSDTVASTPYLYPVVYDQWSVTSFNVKDYIGNSYLDTSSVTCPQYYIRKNPTLDTNALFDNNRLPEIKDFLTCIPDPNLAKPTGLQCLSPYFRADPNTNTCQPTTYGQGAPDHTGVSIMSQTY